MGKKINFLFSFFAVTIGSMFIYLQKVPATSWAASSESNIEGFPAIVIGIVFVGMGILVFLFELFDSSSSAAGQIANKKGIKGWLPVITGFLTLVLGGLALMLFLAFKS